MTPVTMTHVTVLNRQELKEYMRKEEQLKVKTDPSKTPSRKRKDNSEQEENICTSFIWLETCTQNLRFLRNLYAGQEVTVRTKHETVDWFKIGKGCMLSTCLFHLHAEHIILTCGQHVVTDLCDWGSSLSPERMWWVCWHDQKRLHPWSLLGVPVEWLRSTAVLAS